MFLNESYIFFSVARGGYSVILENTQSFMNSWGEYSGNIELDTFSASVIHKRDWSFNTTDKKSCSMNSNTFANLMKSVTWKHYSLLFRKHQYFKNKITYWKIQSQTAIQLNSIWYLHFMNLENILNFFSVSLFRADENSTGPEQWKKIKIKNDLIMQYGVINEDLLCQTPRKWRHGTMRPN